MFHSQVVTINSLLKDQMTYDQSMTPSQNYHQPILEGISHSSMKDCLPAKPMAIGGSPPGDCHTPMPGSASQSSVEPSSYNNGPCQFIGTPAHSNVPSSTLISHQSGLSDGHSQSIVPMKTFKVEVGIQCEVGPETLQALLEDDTDSIKGIDELTDCGKHVLLQVYWQCYIHKQAQLSYGGQIPSISWKQENANSYLHVMSTCCPIITHLLNSYYTGARTSSSSEASFDDRLVQKFPCRLPSCSKAYIHRKDVIRHMRIRHGITPDKLEAIVVEAPEKPHVCGIGSCRRSYFHMKDLRRHRRSCHQARFPHLHTASDPVEVDNTQMRYPCDFAGCLRSYVHKKDLVRHKRLYHKDPSSKPSVPQPVKYTDSDLKDIRQKVKHEIDTKEQKMRLDSTGSTCNSIDGESASNHADCTVLSSSSSLQEVKVVAELDESNISCDVASILGALEQHGSHLFGQDH